MNSLFLSPGPDPFVHLRARMSSVPAAAFQGMWSTIELQPDAFSRQRFTVGVAVTDADGIFNFRLLDDLTKFDCIYGRDDVATLRSLMESAEYSLLRARKARVPLRNVQFDVDAISLGELWPTAGASADVVLNRLYFDVVPFIPKAERRTRDFLTLDNAAVRRLVDSELKLVAGLSFEHIVTEPQRYIVDKSTGVTHALEFNLEPAGKAGNVISAVYKTVDRIELNFLRASSDLATYGRLRRLDQPMALFVMTPQPESMPKADLDRIENVLGEQSWSLEQQDFRVATGDSASVLASDIFEWAAI